MARTKRIRTPGEPAAPVDFRTLLSHRLLVLSNTLGKGAVRHYARQYGVPLAEWRLLTALATVTPASVNSLAAYLGTDKGWISRVAASLVQKGFAITIPDSTDARRFEIALTASGRELYARIEPAAIERHRKLVAVLNEQELRTLDGLLDRLQQQAERLADNDATD